MKLFYLIEQCLSGEEAEIEALEPVNCASVKPLNQPSPYRFPNLLGDLDEVRAEERKAERAAALIYAHFKKEFGGSDDSPTNGRKQ